MPIPTLLVTLTVLATLCSKVPAQVPVRIHWDAENVFYVGAATDEAALWGTGWAQAECAYPVLKARYAWATGRSAEFYGAGAGNANIDHDERIHLLRIPRIADSIHAGMPDDTRVLLEAYVQGINDYFTAHAAEILDSNGPADLMLTEATAQDVIATSLALPALAILSTANKLLNQTLTQDDLFTTVSSNGWVVGGDRLAPQTAGPLLLVDPHVNLQDNIGLWNIVHGVFSPGLGYVGFNQLGVPFIQLGVKLPRPGIAGDRTFAWTVTAGPLDQHDVFAVTLNPDDAGEYFFDGELLPLATRSATVKVKDAADVIFRFQDTVQGPVIRTENGQSHALRSVVDRNLDMISQFHSMVAARDLDEFGVALSQLAWIGGNLVMASSDPDPSRQISYMLYGPVPDRGGPTTPYDWSGIVPGDTSDTLWTSVHPVGDLPAVTGASQDHFIANNASIDLTWPGFTVSNYPTYMVLGPGIETYRQRRARDLVTAIDDATFDDMRDWATDKVYNFATYAIDQLEAAYQSHGSLALDPANITLTELIGLLVAWDGAATTSGQERITTMMRVFQSCFAKEAAIAGHPGLTSRPGWSLSALGLEVVALNTLSGAYNAVYSTGFPSWGEVHRLHRNTPDGIESYPASGTLSALRSAAGTVTYQFDFEASGFDPTLGHDICGFIEIDSGPGTFPSMDIAVAAGQTAPLLVEIGPDAASTRVEYIKAIDNAGVATMPLFSTDMTANWAAEAFLPLATTPDQANAMTVRIELLEYVSGDG